MVGSDAAAARPAAPRVIRLADCTDAAEVEAVLASPDDRGYPFDPDVIAEYWHASGRGESTAAQERILRSAVWRAAFEDVTADVDGRPRRERSGRLPEPQVEVSVPDAPATSEPAASPATRPETPATPTLTAVLLQTQAVKRIARSPMWTTIRDTTPGRRVSRYIAPRR